MKIFKDIIARIFALWALIWFVATMLIMAIPIWMTGLWKEPKRTYTLLKIVRTWMDFYLFIIGLRLQIKGKENFQKGTSYIVICNHNSLIDIPISTPAIPGASKTIAKIEMSRLPIFGMIYKRGSVLVDRKNEQSRKESYIKMETVLEMGMHMCIYPEGTRNKTDQPLQKFHDGAFRLAKQSGHAIMPAVILNTKNVLPVNKFFYYWPSKVKIHFLNPVEPRSLSLEDLKKNVFDVMRDHYVKNQS